MYTNKGKIPRDKSLKVFCDRPDTRFHTKCPKIISTVKKPIRITAALRTLHKRDDGKRHFLLSAGSKQLRNNGRNGNIPAKYV